MPIFKTTIIRVHASENTYIDEFKTAAQAIRSAKYFARKDDWRCAAKPSDRFEVKHIKQARIESLHPIHQSELRKLRKIRAKRRKKS